MQIILLSEMYHSNNLSGIYLQLTELLFWIEFSNVLNMYLPYISSVIKKIGLKKKPLLF